MTSLFMAERLWAKGFSGAKVKMAVFDTGVREDHPHFRNIMVWSSQIYPPFLAIYLLSILLSYAWGFLMTFPLFFCVVQLEISGAYQLDR